jgi:hypothetical protein
MIGSHLIRAALIQRVAGAAIIPTMAPLASAKFAS